MTHDGEIQVEAKIRQNGVETVIRFKAIRMEITEITDDAVQGSEVKFYCDMPSKVDIHLAVY